MARFVLSKSRVKEQYDRLAELGLKVSYSCKTNWEVAGVLEQEREECWFSVHNVAEVDRLAAPEKVWFFPQALSVGEFGVVLGKGVRRFVIDTEEDLRMLLEAASDVGTKVFVVLRMKFQEHRVGSGRYFVYGLSSRRVKELVLELDGDARVSGLGVHVHRKSQNTSEWELVRELEDGLGDEVLRKLSVVNIGGGLPVRYKTYTSDVLPYIFGKLQEARAYLAERGVELWIEPGRFLAAPAVKLETKILQVYGETIVLDCSVYNAAIDTMVTEIRMEIEGELSSGDAYLVKGNTPTRDDIFRYKVFLDGPKVGDRMVFLNAGAYNYWCDFCSLEKLETVVQK